jgi:Ni/Co efflux regulator RcnB
MPRILSVIAATAFIAGLAAAAQAAPALDAKGKCRDIKSKKFVKCGAPGSEPVPKKK